VALKENLLKKAKKEKKNLDLVQDLPLVKKKEREIWICIFCF